jgi:hypothetical protein
MDIGVVACMAAGAATIVAATATVAIVGRHVAAEPFVAVVASMVVVPSVAAADAGN